VRSRRPSNGQLRCRSHLGDDGIGLAESALCDGAGRFGRAEQSLLVDVR
jgi:hypothetical protein